MKTTKKEIEKHDRKIDIKKQLEIIAKKHPDKVEELLEEFKQKLKEMGKWK